jgi:PBP1b-binding outer membrane lipoprotein LpoB
VRKDSVIKKSLLLGLLALLAAVFVFTGCDNGTTTVTEYVPVPGTTTPGGETNQNPPAAGEVPEFVDVATSQSALEAALANPDYKGELIGYGGTTALTGQAVTIPDGYKVYVQPGADLKTASGYGLTVKGKLFVANSAALTIDTAPIVVDGEGNIEVQKGGTLATDEAASVWDGTTDTVLGTDKVKITGTLEYTAGTDFTDAEAVETALGYITSGTLNVGDISSAGLKPSEVAELTIPTGKQLVADTGNTAETDTGTLTIPANLNLTTSATLTTLTGLEVNGTLAAASGTLTGVTELTVNGTLTASSATLASGGATVIVGSGGSATLGTVGLLKGASSVAAGGALTVTAVTAFDSTDNLAVVAGSTVNSFTFPDATDITGIAAAGFTIGNLIVPGVLVLSKNLTLATDAELVIADPTKVSGSSKIIAEDGTIKIGTTAGYTTTSTGVAGTALSTALTAFTSDLVVLATSITSHTDFGAASEVVIGTVVVSSATAGDVKDNTDGDGTGNAIEIDSIFVGTLNTPTVTGSDSSDVSAATLSLAAGALKIADTSCTGSVDKFVILTFSGLKLQNSELIAPTDVPDFSIGLKTARAT